LPSVSVVLTSVHATVSPAVSSDGMFIAAG